MPIQRYNYRIKPTPQQEDKLVEFTSYRRGIWNLLLSENMRRYSYDGTFIFYSKSSILLKELKDFSEFKWIKDFDSAAVQQVARDFDQALREAIDKTNGKRFPSFKLSYHRKKLNNDCYKTVFSHNNIKIEHGTISLPKIGKVPIVLHRELVSEIKTVSIKFEHGHWLVSLTQNVPEKNKKHTLKTAVGYDINSQDMLVGSNGRIDKNPKFLLNSEEKLKQIQRQLSRRVKGSGRWHISKQRLNKLHGTIARQRLDLSHKYADAIAKCSDIVVFEDLNVKGMQAFNGRMVGDNHMGMITSLVEYKVAREGGLFHQIGRFEKSTGVCMHCQHTHNLALNQRSFTCLSCNILQSRDLASAVTIRDKGLKELLSSGTLDMGVITPNAQAKAAVKTKVFTRVKLAGQAEKKEAA